MRKPDGLQDGVRLSRFNAGESYEVDVALGEYLVMLGYAVVELRIDQRSRWQGPERRKRRPIC